MLFPLSPARPPRLATALRSAFIPLILSLVPLVLAAPLRAQTDGVEPWITFSPGSGTFTSPSILVTVRFSDNASIKTSRRAHAGSSSTIRR